MTEFFHHYRRQVLLTVLMSGISFLGWCTHIVGGEVTYSYIGNNVYQVTLTVYRDCSSNNTNNTGFDDNAHIEVFNSAGVSVSSNDIPLSSTNTNYIPVTLDNPCFILPPDVCVQRARYITTLTLPPTAGGYTIVYQRCCANSSVVNINSPQQTGITLTARIPGTNELPTGNNSSPVFNNLPSVAMCMSADYFFHHNATDPDGDSLAYHFCSPLEGADPQNPNPMNLPAPPYTSVNWTGSYNSNNPIAGNPGFQIDAQTGYITGHATQLGMYIVGICVDEFRNGVYLGTVQRVFMFRVTLCDPNIIAGALPQGDVCNGMEFTFTNNSTNGTFFHWDFGVPAIASDTSNVANPSYSYSTPGDYTVTLIANPGWSCADTATTDYHVYDLINPAISVAGYNCIDDQDRYSFTATANASAAALYGWSFGSGSTPLNSTVQNPTGVTLNPENGTNTVSLVVTDHGCSETASLAVNNPPDPVAGIIPQQSFCNGFTYTFQSSSQNAVNYDWQFNTPLNGDNSTAQNPSFTFPAAGSYTVDLIVSAPFTCPDTASTLFTIYPLLQPSFPAQPSQCFEGNNFDFTALGAATDSPVYSWQFGANASVQTSQAANPLNISYSQPGHYDVTLTITENGCTVSYTDQVWIAPNPTVAFTAENNTGCPDLTVRFESEATSETPLAYVWDFGDGNTFQGVNAMHTYTTPGVYDVSLTIISVSGCITQMTDLQPNLVQVSSIPVPGFVIEPQTVDILSPQVTVTSNAMDAVSCYYQTSDGGQSFACDFQYDFTQAGIQTITQVVTNEFGCSRSVTGEVNVTGFLLYIPNSFTPDHDGINDVWIPEGTGITAYELSIYNRWGDKIFYSTDPQKAWTGDVHGGEYFAEDGVYNYWLIVQDLMGFPHEYKGTIGLMR